MIKKSWLVETIQILAAAGIAIDGEQVSDEVDEVYFDAMQRVTEQAVADSKVVPMVRLNGDEVVPPATDLTYEHILEMLNKPADTLLTITYSKSLNGPPEGILLRGDTLKIKHGTRITAMHTGNA